MDFESQDSPEMAAFRGEVQSVLKEIVPKGLVVAADPGKNTDEQYQMRREIARKLGSRGWLYPMIPKEHGGGALTLDHAVVLEQELDEYELESPPYNDSGAMAGPSIMVWGTDEQKKQFLPDIYTGQKVTWMLLTEPHGGSDLASAKTTAIRDGDEYVLNGTKTFVGSDRLPDQFWAIVLTDPKGPRHQNLSWIVVPSTLPGITIQPLNLLSHGGPEASFQSQHNNSVFFEDVHVPAFNLVGGENNGWKVASTHLEIEHGGGGTVRKNRLMERFLRYCKTTEFGGKTLSRDSDVRDIIADLIVDWDVNRLFGMRNYWQRHAKRPGTYEGSQSSYHRKMS
ncbi:MAG: hypothetical protein EXR50_07035, partial [Dehalococcoidia bacterium]|nr:hypothetical protein [Dehalococcoidia bacterium]